MPTDAARLTVDDLEVLAAEASRQNRDLANLLKAMESGEQIAWMSEEKR